LPVFDLRPDQEGEPLARLLVPEAVEPEVGNDSLPPPAGLHLVRGECPQPAAALLCTLATLQRWADQATSRQLAALRVARCGDQALVLGSPLPAVANGRRYWGRRVLVPLGWRPEPDLAEPALIAALELGDQEIALWQDEGIEVLPSDPLAPLTRAGLRLAQQEAT
jgi:hypothetical protein